MRLKIKVLFMFIAMVVVRLSNARLKPVGRSKDEGPIKMTASPGPLASIRPNQVYCLPGQIRQQGIPGIKGLSGIRGVSGIKGASGNKGASEGSVYLEGSGDFRYTYPIPPGTRCKCFKGHRGETGRTGKPGPEGQPGEKGYNGAPGSLGDPGTQGTPGVAGLPSIISPLTTHPPQDDGMMYIPFDKTGNLPQVVCHHFRRQVYVPGIPNSWLGWYETGKSGYLVHENWLYHSTRFICPCSVTVPPLPSESL